MPPRRALVLQEALEDVDRRVERPARRATALGLLLAVPAAIGHLLGQEAVDDDAHVLAEVGADRDGLPVDARLDLAVEVGEVVVLPLHVGADQRKGSPHRFLGRVDPEGAQQLEAGRRRRPFGRVRTAGPGAIGALGSEHGGPPALAGDLGALGRDLLGGRIGQVAHDLPADGRIGVEQPIDDVHANILHWIGDSIRQESFRTIGV